MHSYTQRQKSLNGLPKLLDLSNRVKFLERKHSKIDKTMVSYINLIKNTVSDSVQKQQRPQIERAMNNVRSQQQFRTARKFYPIKNKIKQDKLNNQAQNSQQILNPSNRSKQKDKTSNIHTKLIQNSIRTQTYSDDFKKITIPFDLNTQRDKRQIKGKAYISRKVNNFFQQNNKHTKINKKDFNNNINLKQKQQKQSQKRQQQLKMIELKRKLLQQEQRSIMQFQNCVLYKQKIAQKLRSQQVFKFKQQVNKKTKTGS